jgi:hypothetical protein
MLGQRTPYAALLYEVFTSVMRCHASSKAKASAKRELGEDDEVVSLSLDSHQLLPAVVV